MNPQPITLRGRFVCLEPQTLAHAPDLFAALTLDPSIWQWMPIAPPNSLAEMEALLATNLDNQAKGLVVLFSQIETATGRAVGGTTYLNISRRDRGLEIGSTWLGKPWQRTGIKGNLIEFLGPPSRH